MRLKVVEKASCNSLTRNLNSTKGKQLKLVKLVVDRFKIDVQMQVA